VESITREIAQKGLATAIVILDAWGCSQAQKRTILNISDDSLKCPHTLSVTPELLLRISHILNIHSGLKTLFREPKNVSGFINMVNDNPPFSGRTPLRLIVSGSLKDMEQVANHITMLSVGN
tara:strand:- start:5257 stop:5622 length:366 start_codon:yes stop_codon:yes gene_type:complete